MKSSATLLLCLALVGCVMSCATGGGKQMSADKLALLKPGQTTRAEMIQWFGEPLAIGLDTSGNSSATWHHVRITAAPFYTDMKSQMLIGIFDTNNVLRNFQLSDEIKSTNSAPARATHRK